MSLSQPDRGRRAKAAAAVPMNVKVGRATRWMPRLRGESIWDGL